MADVHGSKTLGDAMASLGTAITSPAKLAFAAYIIVLAVKPEILHASACQFFLVVLFFLAIQILHDDFLRILLNGIGDLRNDVRRASAVRDGRLQLPPDVVERLASVAERLEGLEREQRKSRDEK